MRSTTFFVPFLVAFVAVAGCGSRPRSAAAPSVAARPPAPTSDDADAALDRLGIPRDAPVGLVGRAALPAGTFAEGPTSGAFVGQHFSSQPVQGFSSLVDAKDGTFWALCDNGYGQLENSADFRLRAYRLRPDLKTAIGGAGTIAVEGFVELADPDRKVAFPIVNEFSTDRVLTGADYDVESLRVTPDGTWWVGDEFGPFVLHFDAGGKLLDAPIPLPDPDHAGDVIRSEQNPELQGSAILRLLNAVRAHGEAHGAAAPPVLALAESIIVKERPAPGYAVVPWTVDEPARMTELLRLGVNGIITDRPDLLHAAVAAFDANGDGKAGDYLGADGLIDPAKFDLQGHRGARDLRPENTLPGMEAALDALVTTLETDCGLTSDEVPVLYHDLVFAAPGPGEPRISRRKLGGTLPDRIADVRLASIQDERDPIVNDGIVRKGTPQTNSVQLSPVTVAFWKANGRKDPRGDAYLMPTLEQLFDFVDFYAAYYEKGPGRSRRDAKKRAHNAARVHFDVEAKTDPRAPELTAPPEAFVRAIGTRVVRRGLEGRVGLASFDLRTLLRAQIDFPRLRKVVLLDPAKLAPATGENGRSPWLAGLYWPPPGDRAVRAQASGGFEGMALSPDGTKLYPMLEKPLDAAGKALLVSELDVRTRTYTSRHWFYELDRGDSIGEFVLFAPDHGLVLERDGSQGDPSGFKQVFEVTLPANGGSMQKRLVQDLLRIPDPSGLSAGALPGDVGLGNPFALPYATIESVLVMTPDVIAVLNDNNYPGGRGRHVGAGLPDDDELVFVKLSRRLY